MVEVFKTNVKDHNQAKWLVAQIHKTFAGYQANFDLEDCDKILRVEYTGGEIQASQVIGVLKKSGFFAEVLADNIPTHSSF